MAIQTRTPNRLIREKSPYLLQHAYNPVDWYPWGDEAFAKAKREEKPVFLSIGYSTCHWCHVMERESFEDKEVADILNRYFVAVKVDREERPDVDQVYMQVCQAMNGQGGWPLTILMTPDKKPFFAATYLSKRKRWGHIGLLELLTQVADKWQKDRQRLVDAGEEIAEEIALNACRRDFEADSGVRVERLGQRLLDAAYADLSASFDPINGGFGTAPKFPMPHQIIFLLRHFHLTGEEKARTMAEKTLDAMRRGGIWDHIGFGFSRYSTDARWLVPHFEKMLYDNALLALAYLEAYQVTRKREWARVAEDIFTYVLRDMVSPEGGFYSAEDADSEGEEGRFYIWTPREVESVLGDELGRLFNECYDITVQGHFEGKSIPNLIHHGLPELAARHQMPVEELETALEEARAKLFQAREKRVRPHKDDKILTSWNGLMIAALARGAVVLGNPRYAEAAQRATRFLGERLYRSDGRLLARYRAGESAYPAYLDDYAFLAWGLLELYQATFCPDYLAEARTLHQAMRELFWDKRRGGFFFYGSDAEELFFRPKEVYDGALPSGNSVAAYVLQRLAHLTGDGELADEAWKQLEAFAGEAMRYPAGHAFFLLAVQWAIGPVAEIVVAGRQGDEETEAMLRLICESYLPFAAALFRGDQLAPRLTELAWFVREKVAINGRATAYVCRNHTCLAPMHDVRELAAALGVRGCNGKGGS